MSENNAIKFCTDTNYLSQYFDDVLKNVSSTETLVETRILPRTKSDPRKLDDARNQDFNKALSLQTFDPLWMLSRQWQYGRFQGNDCGTPVSVKVHAVRKSLDANISATPLEYEVEKVNHEITSYVRVESAMYLKKMLIRQKIQKVVAELERSFPLSKYIEELKEASRSDEQSKALDKLKAQKNKALKKFSDFYGKRSFDGYEVYLKMLSNSLGNLIPSDVQKKYIEWFKNKFLPNDSGKESWNSQKLAYEVSMKQGNTDYTTDQYASGRLSWYSFDAKNGEGNTSSGAKSVEKTLTYIPTPATFAGAPARRLWEFEHRRVSLGNGNVAPEYVAAAAVMQYISTYSNDWMITPLETETGTVLSVCSIDVIDTFGQSHTISKSAESLDRNKPSTGPTDRWCLFGSSRPDAYYERDFSSSDNGMLFPPTVLRCEEGAPIEEVQFLRDEMANMLWGVETKINDGCGGYMDGKTLSDAVFKEVDSHRIVDKNETKVDAKYSLLIQNRVPLNWIPFIPEQLKNGRDIIFRRARMPLYYKEQGEPESVDGYKSVRSSTKLLDKNVKPFYINEEEIGGYGIKVTKTPQRTRWFFGQSFNWIGNRKIVSEYQANSGLMFDELLRKEGGVVKTRRKKQDEENNQAEENISAK